MFSRLPGWLALRIVGADAASFLHGQFTNDVAALTVGSTQYNGYCSPKGRMLATFPLLRTAPEEFIVAVPADIAQGLVKRLRMFVLRAKVAIEPLDATHVVFGSTAAVPSIPGSGVEPLALHLPDGRRMAICPAASAALLEEAFAEVALAADEHAWDWLSISAGVPVITTPTQDRFVPQMLNWELVGGVSFQKGCYPGQEIVARMQYLGRLKERLYRARVGIPSEAHRATIGQPAAGQPLYGTLFGTQSCGTLVNAAPAGDDGFELLAVLQVVSAGSDTIRIGIEPDAPAIELLPLPYPVPATKAA